MDLKPEEIKTLIYQKLRAFVLSKAKSKGIKIKKGENSDKELTDLIGLAKMVKVFRHEGQREFKKVFEQWTPDKEELSLLLKELSKIDRTEPIIVDTTDPKIMLDFFGYEPHLIDKYRTVFESHWRQYFEWAKKGMELKKVLNPKGRPSTEKRDRRIRRWRNYILKDVPEGEDNYWIHAISKKDQEVEGIKIQDFRFLQYYLWNLAKVDPIEIKEGEDFWILPSKFKPKTMKKLPYGYYPRYAVEIIPKSQIEESITREFNISKKTLQNILSKNDTTILGKRTLFLMPDGKVIK